MKALGGAKALKSVASVRLRGTVDGSGEFLWLTQRFSDYRRFEVDTSSEIRPPRQ